MTLPSGPTVPPVSHAGPWNEEFSKWPGATMPLLGTENRNVSPQSKEACSPTANHKLPVRRSVRQKNIPITNTLSAPTLSSPPLARCRAPNAADSVVAAGQNPIPEASVNCVTAKQKFFKETDAEKHHSPQRRISPKLRAVQRQFAEGKSSQQPDQEDHPRDHRQSPDDALPEARTERGGARQAVAAKWPGFEHSHDRRGRQRRDHQDGFLDQQTARRNVCARDLRKVQGDRIRKVSRSGEIRKKSTK